MRSSSEEGSYLRLVDLCFIQLQAESNKEEEEDLERAGRLAGGGLPPATRSELFTEFQPSIDFP